MCPALKSINICIQTKSHKQQIRWKTTTTTTQIKVKRKKISTDWSINTNRNESQLRTLTEQNEKKSGKF